jgi:hypothetical protein
MSADQLVKGLAAARSRGLDERAVGIHWWLDLPLQQFIPKRALMFLLEEGSPASSLRRCQEDFP